MRGLRHSARVLPLLPFALLLLSAGQEEVVPAQPPAAVAPDAEAQARAAATRGDPAEALSRYLRVLASRPDDVAALVGAGDAALAVGDTNAAAGFFGRADARAPRNGSVKRGLAETLLQQGNARGALRLFHEAADLGVPVANFALDRGLAYDLRGDQRRAQADYQLVLRGGANDEATRRLALSQAIAGDRATALVTLDPLLRRQDVAAWRARAFIFALTGDQADALAAAQLVMRRDQVAAFAPYLPRLATLRPGDKAAAIHLGRLPNDLPTQTAGPALATRSAAATPAPVTLAVRPALPPLPAAGSTLDPFGAAPTPTAADEQRRERALTEALASARARAGQARAAAPVQLAQATIPPSTPTRVAAARPVDPIPTPPKTDLVRAAEPSSRSGKASPPPAPAGPTRAERLAAEKAKRAEAARRKQEAEEKAQAAAERLAKRRDPARHWVQVAGGANKADLGRAWDSLKEKWPKQLAGRSPWTEHYRFTNRLLIGPFNSSDAAQDWVSERKKEGFATFRVETAAGDPVERVKD